MKRTYLISLVAVVAVMLSSCGRQQYNPFTPTTTGTTGSVEAANPLDNFNTIWTSENYITVGSEFSDSQKRTLSNFFGYNDVYKAWNGCKYGYKNFNTMTCFDSSDPLRTYFLANSYSYKPYPAPKDLGTVKYYKIRFAANVDEATREIIEGDAYLDIELHTATKTFNAVFSTAASSLVVDESTGDIAVTLEDECGDISFEATLLPDGKLTAVQMTFLNTPESYKNPSCYHDGKLPEGLTGYNSIVYPSSIPEGIDSMGGRAQLFISGSTVLINDFVEE